MSVLASTCGCAPRDARDEVCQSQPPVDVNSILEDMTIMMRDMLDGTDCCRVRLGLPQRGGAESKKDGAVNVLNSLDRMHDYLSYLSEDIALIVRTIG